MFPLCADIHVLIGIVFAVVHCFALNQYVSFLIFMCVVRNVSIVTNEVMYVHEA